MRQLRLSVVMLLMAFAPWALAQQMCPQYRFGSGPWAVSPDAAFSAWQGTVAASGSVGCGGDYVNPYNSVGIRGGESIAFVRTTYSGCTSGGGGAGVSDSGTVYLSSQTVPCAEPQCVPEVGSDNTVRNVTIGYTRSPDSNTVVGTPFNPWAPAAGACDGMCEVTFGVAVSAWTSTSPTSSGLYRQSVDMQTQRNGNACNTRSVQLDPQSSNVPACPGVVGEVNGKPYCVGTAASPVANDQPMPPPTVPPSVGNPTAGSTPTPGQDRTPSVGGGGPEGGPSVGAGPGAGGTVILPGSGGGPGGTVTKPADGTEQAECGAPGQPKCGIDETGTPTATEGKGKFSDAKTATDKAGADLDKAIADAGALTAPGWSWTFALPSGCTNTVLNDFGVAGITVDVCSWQSLFHDLMSLCWIGAAIWCCIGMVGRTLKGA